METEKKIIGKVLLESGNKKEYDLYSYTDANGNYRQEANGEDFDGHRILWGFSYEPHNYLKESDLSGDEYRKGGYMTITRNGVSVFKEFCRNPERAFVVLQYTLPQLQDFWDWDNVKVGHKLYNRNQPCVITSVCDDGEIVVKTEDGKPFIWAFKLEHDEEDSEDDDWYDSDRIHILSPQLHWSRK